MPWAEGLVALVALGALLLYFVTFFRVGLARMKYKVEAPATTGHPEFERIFRVQQNTLEQLPIFLVALFLFSIHVNELAAAALGLVWILGRVVYMQGYVAAAKKRAPGFLLSMLASAILLIGAIIGVVLSILGGLPS